VRAAPRILAAVLAVALLGACTAAKPTVTPTTAPPAVDPAKLAAHLSDADLAGAVLLPALSMDATHDTMAALVNSYHVAGVILMPPGDRGSGANDASAVAGLTASVQAAGSALPATVAAAGVALPMLIGTDQEYGFVTRIPTGMVQLPSPMAFGAAGRPELTRSAWQAAGTELAAIGVNVDFAPDADVIASAGNTVIGSRSFGSASGPVSTQVGAAVAGLQSAGVAASVKHFPGHGNTTVDSHTSLPVLTQSLESLQDNDLPPFEAGISADVSMVMIGHLDVRAVDPGVAATFSPKVITDLLKTQLGFRGVVVTDALNMEPAEAVGLAVAPVRALQAGADLLLMPPDVGGAYRAVLAALKDGTLPRQRLVDAATRVLALRLRLGTSKRPPAGVLGDSAHAAAAAAVSSAAVTVLAGPCDGPLVPGPVRVTSSAGRDRQVAQLVDALRRNGVAVADTGGSQVHLIGYGDAVADLAPAAAVTVAMDSPYLLASAKSPVKVATYSYTPAALEALASVIAGATAAPGRSPVDVAGLPRSACVS
jgi:beta-N-acetylhexosaminidase